MPVSKELRPLLKSAEKAGWNVSMTKKCHLRWQPPDGGEVVISPSTPSDHRSIRNVRAQLRHRGLQV